MNNSMIQIGQNSFLIAEETQELLKNLISSKFSNDHKNVSRHCGGHYNIKIRRFEDFSGGAVSAPPHVK